MIVRPLLKLRPIELVLIAAIVIIVALLLRPSSQWAADGEIDLRIKVFVFDAANCRPIAGAKCFIFYTPPALDPGSLAQFRCNDQALIEGPHTSRGHTDSRGLAELEHQFRTGANHLHPQTHAHLINASVQIMSQGYGGVIVPVRYEDQLTADLRKSGPLMLSIGLFPND